MAAASVSPLEIQINEAVFEPNRPWRMPSNTKKTLFKMASFAGDGASFLFRAVIFELHISYN